MLEIEPQPQDDINAVEGVNDRRVPSGEDEIGGHTMGDGNGHTEKNCEASM